ncbi:MAG: transposase [Nostoc sp.]
MQIILAHKCHDCRFEQLVLQVATSIHPSNIILDKIDEWNERGITIFKLPCYSPELNLIEILFCGGSLSINGLR